MNEVMTSGQRGQLAEDKALRFLEKQELKLLDRNYRTRRGEIDLVMQDRDVTVFIEVRSRSSERLLNAVETIDKRKQDHIILAGEHYLQNRRIQSACRFDVVTITGPESNTKIDWIKNAFEA